MSLMLVCSEDITLSASGFPECLSGWSTQLAVAPFSIDQIDPVVAVSMFSSGFLIFLIPMAFAFGISKVLQLVKG